MPTRTLKGEKVTVGAVITDSIARIESDTPPFFQRIRTWASWALLITGSITAGLGTMIGFGIAIPIWIPIATGIITSMATSIAGTANLPTQDREILARPTNQETIKYKN